MMTIQLAETAAVVTAKNCDQFRRNGFMARRNYMPDELPAALAQHKAEYGANNVVVGEVINPNTCVPVPGWHNGRMYSIWYKPLVPIARPSR